MYEKFFGFLPDTFAFDSLIDDILIDSDVKFVDEGADLFVDEGHVVFRVLSCQVNIF